MKYAFVKNRFGLVKKNSARFINLTTAALFFATTFAGAAPVLFASTAHAVPASTTNLVNESFNNPSTWSGTPTWTGNSGETWSFSGIYQSGTSGGHPAILLGNNTTNGSAEMTLPALGTGQILGSLTITYTCNGFSNTLLINNDSGQIDDISCSDYNSHTLVIPLSSTSNLTFFGTNDVAISSVIVTEVSPATGTDAVSKIGFNPATPQTIDTNTASGVISVVAEDASGNPVKLDTSSNPVTLTSTSSTGLFASASSSTNTCNNDWASTGSLTMAKNTSSIAFCYKDVTAGTPTITAKLTDSANILKTWTGNMTISVTHGPVEDTTQKTYFPDLQSAVNAASSGDTLSINNNLTTTSQVTINKSLVVEGNGHTISPDFARTNTNNDAAINIEASNVTINDLTEDGTLGSNDLIGINTYEVTGINLDNVTLENNDSGLTAALVVNGSNVTVDNITTKDNLGGIDVDQGSGVTTPAVLTVSGTSNQSDLFGDIYIDDTAKNVTVNDTNNQYNVHYNVFHPGDAVYTLKPAKPTSLTIVQNGKNLGCSAATNQRPITVSWDADTNPGFQYFEYQNRLGIQKLGTQTSFSGNIGGTTGGDGVYTYSVRAVYASGSSNWATCSITYDTVDPTISITSPNDGSTVKTDGNSGLTISGNAQDSQGTVHSGISLVWVKLCASIGKSCVSPSSETTAPKVDANGNWSLNLSQTDLANYKTGDHLVVMAMSRDGAGNDSALAYATYLVRNTPPQVLSGSISAVNPGNFTSATLNSANGGKLKLTITTDEKLTSNSGAVLLQDTNPPHLAYDFHNQTQWYNFVEQGHSNTYVAYINLNDPVLKDKDLSGMLIDMYLADSVGNYYYYLFSGSPSGYATPQNNSWLYLNVDNVAPDIQINGNEVTGNPYYKLGEPINAHIIDANLSDTQITRLNATNDNHWDYHAGHYFGLWWLRDGDYSMTSTDKAGNSTTVTFRVDHTLPVVSGNYSGGTVNGSVVYNPTSFTINANDDRSNNPKGDVQSGLASVTGHIYKYNDSTSKYELFVGGPAHNSNTLTLNLNNLTDGKYYVKYNAKDVAGNTSQTKEFYFTIDHTAPAVPTNLSWLDSNGNPATNGFTNVQKGTLSWQDSDAGVDHYVYKFWTNIPGYYDGEANAWTTDNSSYFTTTSTGGSIWTNFYNDEGTYYFCVEAVDAAGNTSACSDTYTVTYDTTILAAPTLASPTNGQAVNGANVTNSWDPVTGAVKYEYQSYDDSNLTGLRWDHDYTTTSKTATNVADSTVFYWRVRAIDQYGKTGPWSDLWQVIVDSSAPNAPTATPSGGNYTGPQQVSLSATDNNGGSGIAAIYYTTDGTTPSSTNGTKYTGAITVNTDTTIEAIAYDNAGNASPVMSETYGIAPVISGQGYINPTTSTITLVWTTNQPATSRVIYDTVSHPTLGAAPNYGYAFTTPETNDQPNEVTSHSVTITGLTPGTTYYFRTVSHGSPESVSPQVTGVTKVPSTNGTPTYRVNTASSNGSSNGTNGQTGGTGNGQVLGTQTTTPSNTSNGSTGHVKGDQTTVPSSNAATTTSKDTTSGFNYDWLWLLLLLLLIPIYYLATKKSDKEQN